MLSWILHSKLLHVEGLHAGRAQGCDSDLLHGRCGSHVSQCAPRLPPTPQHVSSGRCLQPSLEKYASRSALQVPVPEEEVQIYARLDGRKPVLTQEPGSGKASGKRFFRWASDGFAESYALAELPRANGCDVLCGTCTCTRWAFQCLGVVKMVTRKEHY